MNEKFRHEDEKQKKVTIEELKSTQKRSNIIIVAHLDISVAYFLLLIKIFV